MPLQRGDHACLLYSTTSELVEAVASFLAEGLRYREQCWYVASGAETDAIRIAPDYLTVEVNREVEGGALKLIPAADAYILGDRFRT